MTEQMIRDRIAEIREQWRISVTDEQMGAIVRVALAPRWEPADRWAESVIQMALQALRAFPRGSTSPR